MEKYIKEFNLLYPNYQTKDFVEKCVIADPNCNPESDFLELTVTGCDGNLFPMNFASDSISFSSYIYSQKHKVLLKNMCDKMYYPLDVPSFCIHYLGVPCMQQKYSIGIDDILKL